MPRPSKNPSTDRPVSAPANGTNGQNTAPAAGNRRNRTGMPWKRYFTKPGVGAFDEVEWETRAASITNEKGEVVFEQRDVEIPRGWSQVATNVVVSKYFRGVLGTPDRERSVKQLIGRVARTIHEWGGADQRGLHRGNARSCRTRGAEAAPGAAMAPSRASGARDEPAARSRSGSGREQPAGCRRRQSGRRWSCRSRACQRHRRASSSP